MRFPATVHESGDASDVTMSAQSDSVLSDLADGQGSLAGQSCSGRACGGALRLRLLALNTRGLAERLCLLVVNVVGDAGHLAQPGRDHSAKTIDAVDERHLPATTLYEQRLQESVRLDRLGQSRDDRVIGRGRLADGDEPGIEHLLAPSGRAGGQPVHVVRVSAHAVRRRQAFAGRRALDDAASSVCSSSSKTRVGIPELAGVVSESGTLGSRGKKVMDEA